jgi:hypothetical protein
MKTKQSVCHLWRDVTYRVSGLDLKQLSWLRTSCTPLRRNRQGATIPAQGGEGQHDQRPAYQKVVQWNAKPFVDRKAWRPPLPHFPWQIQGLSPVISRPNFYHSQLSRNQKLNHANWEAEKKKPPFISHSPREEWSNKWLRWRPNFCHRISCTLGNRATRSKQGTWKMIDG